MNPIDEYTKFKDPKYCFIPSCKNNSLKDKTKMFFVVPSEAKHDWCIAVGAACLKRNLYICEDHLNLQEDMENYMYWTTMKSRPKLKTSLPQSLVKQLHTQPEASTSSSVVIPMDIDNVHKDKNIILCMYKGIQVKPKTADRTTLCSINTNKLHKHCQEDNDDFLCETISIDDAIPSTQGSVVLRICRYFRSFYCSRYRKNYAKPKFYA